MIDQVIMTRLGMSRLYCTTLYTVHLVVWVWSVTKEVETYCVCVCNKKDVFTVQDDVWDVGVGGGVKDLQKALPLERLHISAY